MADESHRKPAAAKHRVDDDARDAFDFRVELRQTQLAVRAQVPIFRRDISASYGDHGWRDHQHRCYSRPAKRAEPLGRANHIHPLMARGRPGDIVESCELSVVANRAPPNRPISRIGQTRWASRGLIGFHSRGQSQGLDDHAGRAKSSEQLGSRRGENKAKPLATGEFSHLATQYRCGGPIEGRAEFVRDDQARLLSLLGRMNRARQSQSITLAITELARGCDQCGGLSQPTSRQDAQSFPERSAAQGFDRGEIAIGLVGGHRDAGGLIAGLCHRAKQHAFSRARWAYDSDDLAGRNVQFEIIIHRFAIGLAKPKQSRDA